MSGEGADLPPRQAAPARIDRLRRRTDFLSAQRGAKFHGGAMVVQAVRREDAPEAAPRVGFTVTKKIGNAVERNRIRRRLREAVRQSGGDGMRRGHDYVIVARRAAIEVPFERLCDEIAQAMRRVHRSAPGREGDTGSS